MEQKDRNYTLTPWCDLSQNVNYSNSAIGPKTEQQQKKMHRTLEELRGKRKQTWSGQNDASNFYKAEAFEQPLRNENFLE